MVADFDSPHFRFDSLERGEMREACLRRVGDFPHLRKVLDDSSREFDAVLIRDACSLQECGLLISPKFVTPDAEFVGAVWGDKASQASRALVQRAAQIAQGQESFLLLWNEREQPMSEDPFAIQLSHVEMRMSRFFDGVSLPSLPSPRVGLVPAARGDAEFVIRMNVEGFGDSPESARDSVLRKLRGPSPHKELLVARQGDMPVGVVQTARSGDLVMIYGLVVAREAQGKGLAKDMVHALLLRSLPCRGKLTFWLEVDTANEPALRTYRAAGFVEDCQTVYYRILIA